ncbi:hypothetical protein BX600DRAFT_428866 [Xylariales sp. PMI_506]|nr:hypothetical protein BX600DRAFT_428866 [Xylariales sp. PMI_506]
MPLTVSDVPLRCECKIPNTEDTARTFLDRWSDTDVALPAITITPETEQDVIDSIHYAQSQGFQIVAAGGKHGSFVPVTERTLYLDLTKFNSISLDKETETVTIGGGVTTGNLLTTLAAEGFYTCLPNGNEVGVVGAFLGGGGSLFNGVKGFLTDHAVSIRIITADGKLRVLDGESLGEEARLYQALRGAGQGLGVITKLTVKIFPLASLGMTDGKAWVRRTVFPASAIDVAAVTYERLRAAIVGPVSVVLLFARAPPPVGQPVIVLIATYLGPSAEAEKLLSPLLMAPEVLGNAVVKITTSVAMEDSNKPGEALSPHGGFKIVDSAFLSHSSLTAETIREAFACFVALTGEGGAPDAAPTAWLATAWDPTVSVANGKLPANQKSFFGPRDRGATVFHYAWCTEESSVEKVKSYVARATEIVTRREAGPFRRFANNLRFPANLAETYPEDRLAELRKIRDAWDPTGLFWKPGMEAA